MYPMSLFLLPQRICKEIDSTMPSFGDDIRRTIKRFIGSDGSRWQKLRIWVGWDFRIQWYSTKLCWQNKSKRLFKNQILQWLKLIRTSSLIMALCQRLGLGTSLPLYGKVYAPLLTYLRKAFSGGWGMVTLLEFGKTSGFSPLLPTQSNHRSLMHYMRMQQ